jgi:AcrR family transcriptional regulator
MMSSKKDAVAVREPPRTARGARTRAALVAAARTVFERDGYLNARLTDITAQAKCSTGSFYTYFNNKEEIFAAVLEEAQEEMLHPHVREVTDSEDPVAVIEASNRAYLEAYERNAKLMRLLEQVATIDDNFRDLRRRRGELFAQRALDPRPPGPRPRRPRAGPGDRRPRAVLDGRPHRALRLHPRRPHRPRAARRDAHAAVGQRAAPGDPPALSGARRP